MCISVHSNFWKGIPMNIFGGHYYIIYMIILHGNIPQEQIRKQKQQYMVNATTIQYLAIPVLGCTKEHFRTLTLLYELLCILPFVPFQNWCKCHHLKDPTLPEHHYMTSDIITWCPNDVMLFVAGMIAHAPGRYAEWISSLGAVMPKWTLSFSFHRARNSCPRCIPWHSPPSTLKAPNAEPARVQFIVKNILKTY